MKRILIADASKASLVMTSEVFKDHFPGVQVVVARTSADAIELAKSAGELDAFIIDYDLPDRDGAYTAARLKKMFTQPILITAFDRPDVHESIDRELAAFDDCLSWLKKPVKPELVVSLAQRFIEGQHRCQRRVNCALPAFIEVEFAPPTHLMAAVGKAAGNVRTMQVARAKVVAKGKAKPSAKAAAVTKSGKKIAKAASTKAAVSSSKSSTKAKPVANNSKKVAPKKANTKTVVAHRASKAEPKVTKVAAAPAKKPTPDVQLKPVRKFIPVILDDVSLGGVKIRVNNQEMILSLGGKGKASQMFCDFREGQILNLFVPPSQVIEAGTEALQKWQKSQAKELAGMQQKDGGAGVGKSADANVKSPTLTAARRTTKTSEAEIRQDAVQTPTNVLRGEVRWTASSETFTFCGVRSETINVSKKLFESMIEIESRARAQLSPMVSPNVSRAAKLNA
ncbi:MAG: response regulator [Betaproteobacteria bacterium]|nr:response regulator [Betaproteobacteria bacterium]